LKPLILVYDSSLAKSILQVESDFNGAELTANPERLCDAHIVVFHIPAAPNVGIIRKYPGQIWVRFPWKVMSTIHAPVDNNVCERALKKAILHRKNSLFYKTENGAHVGDIFMSLIHTAELCGANPFHYLTELQRHADELEENPSQWMPWNYRSTLQRADAAINSG
jgi:hypothetical protein